MKKPKLFATEVDLCAAFIAALPKGWTSYAETAGWDILLSRDVDGFQIGIQAKLKCNARVLNQAIEESGSPWAVMNSGPDCRAVLVPDGESDLGAIASYIGVTVIRMRAKGGWSGSMFLPQLPTSPDDAIRSGDWHEWAPACRHKLPEYVPDVAAGAPAPVQLTKWKIGAIKIAVTMELRGWVDRADFKAHGIDPRRWLPPNGWLTTCGGRFTPCRMPDFRAMHPTVYEQIKADAEKWMPLRMPA
jgi:hypothetical protein